MTDRMRQRVLWVVWALGLIVLLAAVAPLNRRASMPSSTGTAGAALRHGFHLDESATKMGVAFTHDGPTFDAKLAHIMPQVASTGAAVAVADFDRDGWQDFYVTN